MDDSKKSHEDLPNNQRAFSSKPTKKQNQNSTHPQQQDDSLIKSPFLLVVSGKTPSIKFTI